MPRKHSVKAGECLASIAERYGVLDWRQIYEAPGNEELRKKRPNPHVLRAGDVVTIPDPPGSDGLTVTLATGETKQVEIEREPVVLRLDVLDELGGPGAEARYELSIDGLDEPIRGEIPASGQVEAAVPALARTARLALISKASGEVYREYELAIGDLDPVTTPRGLRERLRRLGIDPGSDPQPGVTEDEGGPFSPALESALRAFQVQQGFEESGEATEETQDKLVELVGA
jgi:N-acetylmuramoyl-L-alanine amidase